MTSEQAWYRHFWPWFMIALLSASVLGGMATLAIAVSNPDPLVISEDHYRDIRDEMKAMPVKPATGEDAKAAGNGDDTSD